MHFEGRHAPPITQDATREAIQHHTERLALNHVRHPFAPSNPRAAGMFREGEHRSSRGVTDWLGITGKHAVAKDVKTMFNPTTREGIANLAGMFMGGGSFKGESVKMPGEYEPYSVAKATVGGNLSKDSRGRPIAMHLLANRARGVGGYRRANPLDVIEGLHNEQSKLSQTREDIKAFSNRRGAAYKEQNDRASQEAAIQEALGGKLIPYRGKANERPGTPERQSYDYSDRLSLLNLMKNNPDNPLLAGAGTNPIMRAIHDLLFRQGYFNGPKPPRP